MDPLSAEHLAVLAAIAALCAGAVAWPRRRPGAPAVRVAARALAVVLLVDEVAIRLVTAADGDWSWAGDLPLHLSDAAILTAALALWPERPRPLLFELTYLWAFTATMGALLTPDLGRGPDHVLFWTFFLAHGGVLVAACHLAWGRGLVPRRGAALRALGATAAWAVLAGVGSLATGGNYMFLREKPERASLLDLLGPWPWYLVASGVLAAALFSALVRVRRAGARA